MDDETTLSQAADDLADAAESVSDAADAVAKTPADAVDTTPIADAIDDAADRVTDLDHAERLARLEARLEGTEFARAEHEHSDYAFAGHAHISDVEPAEDIPLPSEPVVETSDDEPESEPTDEPPKRRHFLARRIGDIFGG